MEAVRTEQVQPEAQAPEWRSIDDQRTPPVVRNCSAGCGALVCLGDWIHVFALNVTYDVPVKPLSFHLILLSLFVLAPDLKRLADFFF